MGRPEDCHSRFGITRRRLKWYGLFNILILIIYILTINGGRTTVSFEVNNDEYVFYLDGLENNRISLEEWLEGGIGYFQYYKSVPVIPQVQRLDHITVTDIETDQILFEDDFNNLKDSRKKWRGISSYSIVNGGLNHPIQGAKIFTRSGWKNYRVVASVWNLTGAQFYLRVQDDSNFVGCFMRPFRDFDSRFFCMKDHDKVYESKNKTTFLAPVQTLKRILNLLLYSYPFYFGLVLSLMIISIFLTIILQLFINWFPRLINRIKRLHKFLQSLFVRRFINVLVIVILCFCFGWLLFVTVMILEKIPHVQDSTVMLYQAKTLASGRLWTPIPEMKEHFDVRGFIHFKNGKMFGQYPLGYPLFLAIGALFGVSWIIPALAGTLLLFVVYRLMRLYVSSIWSFLTITILFCSPFFQMTAPNFMSHTVGALYLAISLFFVLKIDSSQKCNWRYPLFSGLFLGLLFHTRPMTALSVCISYGLWGLYRIVKTDSRRNSVKQYSILVCVFIIFVGLFLLYNYVVMGDPFLSTYGKTAQKVTDQTFDYSRLSKAMLDGLTLSSLFVMVALGWSNILTLVPLFGHCLPEDEENTTKGPLFLVLVTVPIAYLLYSWSSVVVMYGPRYVFEILFVFVVLFVLGIRHIIHFVTMLTERLYGRRVHIGLTIISVRNIMNLCLMVFLFTYLGISFMAWLNKNHSPWPGNAYVPQNLYDLNHFNSIRPVTQTLVEDRHISNALVFVGSGEGRAHQWWHYGSVFHENNPTFNGDVVYAKDLGDEKNRELMKLYPGRSYFLCNYNKKTLEPILDNDN